MYLAHAPELGQKTMTDDLTGLLNEVFRQAEDLQPRLVYVTDAGDNETSFYHRVLRKLRHPSTGKRLPWQWIVDYFHASQRLTTIAEALFRPGREASAGRASRASCSRSPTGHSRCYMPPRP